jgi:hypothetical protein
VAVVIASEDIKRSTATHPSGITGISVECAVGLSVAELAVTIPHGQVGVTTVGEVRSSDSLLSCSRISIISPLAAF